MVLTQPESNIIADMLQVFSTAGVPFANAKLFVAQSMHETFKDGFNFYSKLCRNDNNYFGMKIPSVRKSPYISGVATSIPPSNEGKNGYAAYKSMKDSALDRLHKAKFDKIDFAKTNTVDSFVAHIAAKGYFGYNPTAAAVNIYKSGMNRHLAEMKDFIEPVLVPLKKKLQ